MRGFPSGLVVNNLPWNVGDAGWVPGLGRSHMPWSIKACKPQSESPCNATKRFHIMQGRSDVLAVALRSSLQLRPDVAK